MTDLFDGEAEKAEKAKAERAIVFVLGPGDAIFLKGFGPGIEEDLDAGLDRCEVGPTMHAPPAPGLWVWDGTPLWCEERSEGVLEGCVPDYKGRGEWRRMTSGEALQFADFGTASTLEAP